MKRYLLTLAVLGISLFGFIPSFASEIVTVDNFVRAESDTYFAKTIKMSFGTLYHAETLTPIEWQDIIRSNRDTLYSIGIFDLNEPLTIVKPESGGRFQSMQVINQDHSTLPVEHGSGEFTLTKEKVGTRYACIFFRTFVDPNNKADVMAAWDLQGRIKAQQKNRGKFEIPDWDQESLKKVREAIKVLASTRSNLRGMFGDKAKLNPIDHLLGTAYAWGGNPDEAVIYDNVVPEKNDGKTPYSLTVKDVPVDGFWSITVYNKGGYMVRNAQNAYSFNNVTAKKNADGSITINFGGGSTAINNLPIIPGWNYIVRLYQPRKEILNESWKFPKAKPVE